MKTMAQIPNVNRHIEIVRTIRANFGDDQCDVAEKLLDHSPNGSCFTTKAGAAGYHRGLVAGLGAQSRDPEPVNPYHPRPSNFARGANNPHEAWKAGLRDGMRVRTLLLWPEKIPTLVPALKWREAKIIGYEQKAKPLDMSVPLDVSETGAAPNGGLLNTVDADRHQAFVRKLRSLD